MQPGPAKEALVTPVRRRMIEDMTLRSLAARTIKIDVRRVTFAHPPSDHVKLIRSMLGSVVELQL